MKQILLFVAMLVLASYVGAMAETYEVDGIYYTTSLDAVSAMGDSWTERDRLL